MKTFYITIDADDGLPTPCSTADGAWALAKEYAADYPAHGRTPFRVDITEGENAKPHFEFTELEEPKVEHDYGTLDSFERDIWAILLNNLLIDCNLDKYAAVRRVAEDVQELMNPKPKIKYSAQQYSTDGVFPITSYHPDIQRRGVFHAIYRKDDQGNLILLKPEEQAKVIEGWKNQ